MSDNYKPIQRLTDKLLHEYYQMIEKDLEKIINSPSTINSIFKYYRVVGWQEDMNHYLVFYYNDEWIVVKTYSIDEFIRDYHLKEQIEYWIAESLIIIPPKPIMF